MSEVTARGAKTMGEAMEGLVQQAFAIEAHAMNAAAGLLLAMGVPFSRLARVAVKGPELEQRLLVREAESAPWRVIHRQWWETLPGGVSMALRQEWGEAQP